MLESSGSATAATDDPHRPAPKMRASDADRHATVATLQDAMARGLLTPAEASDRMSAAFTVVHLEDLPPITADLPKNAVRSKAAGWRPLLLEVLEQVLSSVRSVFVGRPRPVQWGAALLLVFLLITCGLTIAHVVLDGGSGPGFGGPPRRSGLGGFDQR